MDIETREQLAQYKQGLIGGEAIWIHVHSSVKCNISDVEPFFNNLRLLTVYLSYEDGSTVSVSPAFGKVQATFAQVETELAKLPKRMTKYEIKLIRDAVVTDADIDAIVEWFTPSAETISIIGVGNVAYRLSQRLDGIKGSSRLHLHLTVDRQSYKQLDASKFLAALRRTTIVFVAADDMTESEFDEFVNNQTTTAFFTMSSAYRQLTFRHI